MTQDEEKTFSKLVGIRLRWARKEAGVSAAELGEVVGVSHGTPVRKVLRSGETSFEYERLVQPPIAKRPIPET